MSFKVVAMDSGKRKSYRIYFLGMSKDEAIDIIENVHINVNLKQRLNEQSLYHLNDYVNNDYIDNVLNNLVDKNYIVLNLQML